MKDLVDILLAFARRERPGQAPQRVQALAKLHMIDGIAAMFAGAPRPESRALQSGLTDDDKYETALIAVTSVGDAPIAALLNTFRGRLLSYDDVQTTETSIYGLLLNPTVPVLAAVLPLAQLRKVSGTEMLRAYLVGVEIATGLVERLELSQLQSGFPVGRIFGGIGALFASVTLLGFSREMTRAAVAIWASGVSSMVGKCSDSMSAAISEAQSVRGAVEAAILCDAGAISSPRDTSSFLERLGARPTTKRLGNPYSILSPGFAIRVYPCDALAHPAIDLILAIVNLHDIHAVQIEHIEIRITSVMGKMLVLTPPEESKDLRRNLPFLIALAAFNGVIESKRLFQLPRQTEVRRLMRATTCHVDCGLDTLGHERARTALQVTLRNGRVIEMKADVAKGTPQKPLSEIELFHKFFHCAQGSIDETRAEQVLNRLWLLDEVRNVADIFSREPLEIDRRNDAHTHASTEHHHRH
jgi:2-methylcitrate dehydratase PrpD